MTDFAIQTSGLTKRFGKLTAFADVSLRVRTGCKTALLAPTDGSKTSLVKSLLGLYSLTAGSGTLLGMDIASDSMKIRRNVGYAPQEPMFDETQTISSAIHFAARFASPDDAVSRSAAMLDRFGFTGKEKRIARNCDYVDRARLAVAQAFVNNPPLVILDQSIDDLDPLDRDEMFQRLNVLHKERGTTILLVTKNTVVAELFADDVIIMINGRVVAQDGLRELVGSHDLDQASVRVGGERRDVLDQIRAQAWVKSVISERVADGERWTVITEDGAAAAKLLPLLAGSGVSVLEFQADHLSLEDVFKQLLMKAEAA
jgi:ABC-type multidrug transport system ATPase subunit